MASACVEKESGTAAPPSVNECRDAPEEEGPASAAEPHSASGSVADALQKLRDDIAQRTAAILAKGPAYQAQRTLNEFNAEAAKQQKAGELAAAVATYNALFAKARQSNVTHPELYICHSNCAGAYLKLGLYTESLQHANKCQALAQASLRRNFNGCASYIKSYLRKGQALLGLGCNREAATTLDAGLKMDPFNLDLKQALQAANQAVLKDLAEGRGRERKAIEYPEAHQRISYHPYSAPLHKIKTDDMLPLKLLTPFQGENDHHIRDTYNYVTVQTDIRMPKRHLRVLDDGYFNSRFQQAIEAAVKAVANEEKDCRVLNLGSGSGLHAMIALRAGAHHVTAVERWLYLALASKACLIANKFPDEKARVVYKRPTDLKIKEDVPVCCNLMVANIFDEGLLTSGIVPSARHALGSLLTSDAILLPSSATVYMQAVELRTGNVCGLNMTSANLYRWHPAYAAGVPLAHDRIIPLSEPREVWYFDVGAPPDKSDVKSVDLEFTRDGRFNAIMFWYKLHLYGDVYLSTGPEAVEQGLRCLQPAVQYIAGELPVEQGLVLPVVASHNTVRLRFDVESTEFLNLYKPDASFPACHFSMLADEARCQAYERALRRVVKQRHKQDGEVHVLDIGCGTGILSLLAARAGANSVVACDIHDSLCDVARKTATANDLSHRISVVQKDVGLLQRGREVRPLGVNVVVADVFDAGLLGHGFPYMLELTKRKVVQPGATIVPCAATLYCMGIEALTGQVAGFNMTPMNTFRWDANYEAVDLSELPHRRLTNPVKVLEHFFDGERKGRSRESMLKLEVVAEGVLNAVVFWFDLHLDDCETLTNAPDGIGEGGQVLSESSVDSGSGSGSGDSSATLQPSSAGQPLADLAEADKLSQPAATSPTSVCQQPEISGSTSTATRGQPATDKPAAAVAGGKAADGKSGACAGEAEEEGADDFLPAGSFAGTKPGYVFKLGDLGLGYYLDGRQTAAASQPAPQGADVEATAAGQQEPAAEQPAAEGPSTPDESNTGSNGAATSTIVEGSSSSSGGGAASAANQTSWQARGPPGPGPCHHWGQALQYLERAVAVQPGRKVALLARREEGKLRFALRQGVGEFVEKAPWKIEWGGGSSVENPHFQRVHYCQLLVSDFLQRVKCRRFPPIEKDMKMVLAHCGSLLLDPAALQEVCHEMVMMEKIQLEPEYSPAASLEAVTKVPLRLH